MNYLKRCATGFAIAACLYFLLPLAVFDFSSIAVPCDEEYLGNQQVVIGPRPHWWVPYAAHDFDWPGGYGYAPNGWTFVVWKPLCLWFIKAERLCAPQPSGVADRLFFTATREHATPGTARVTLQIPNTSNPTPD